MEWKACNCKKSKTDPQVAIILPVFYDEPDEAQRVFALIHRNELVCFHCGGQVHGTAEQWKADHVTGSATMSRLRTLGIV